MIVELILIALSVSLDAFAISIGKGLAATKIRPIDAVKTACWFAGLQALFPVLGFFAASALQGYVEQIDHWIIFGLLTLIGANMIRETLHDTEVNDHETANFDWRHMLPLAIACSIDAFAVGVSFAFMRVNIPFAIGSIGVMTAVLSVLGLYLGRIVGKRWQKPSQIAGGIVPILIGVKVLLEHLGIIA
jgi:putative Mn2+ efflux pump MntP